MNRSLLLVSLGMMCASIMTSCKESLAEQKPVPEISVEPAWYWDAYPLARTIPLSTVAVRLDPKGFREFRSDSQGELTLSVLEVSREVREGELWAELDVEQVRTREEELAVQEQLSNLSKAKLDKVDLPQQKFALASEIEKARKKIALIKRLLASEVSHELEAVLGIGPGEVSNEQLVKAEKALSLLEAKSNFVNENDQRIRGHELRLREIEMERSRTTLQGLKDSARFESPFTGTLELKFPLEKGRATYPVRPRQLLASVSDFSSIHASVAITSSSLLEYPPESLTLILGNRTRTRFSFQEEKTTRSDRRGQLERFYLFDCASREDLSSIRRLVGSTLSGEVSLELPEDCHLVPKTEIAVFAVGKSKLTRWADLIPALWPGRALVAEGTTTVAISTVSK